MPARRWKGVGMSDSEKAWEAIAKWESSRALKTIREERARSIDLSKGPVSDSFVSGHTVACDNIERALLEGGKDE